MHRTAIILLTALLPGALFGQAGESGLSFLKLGTSARGIAMADAMSAHVSGAAATYYNPAGLRPPDGDSGNPGQITLMHREWIQDTRTEFLGAIASLGQADVLGLSVNATSVADIEIRTVPGPADGTFTAKNYAVGLSYSHRFSENVVAGATGKFLYEKILVDDASGWGIDLGAQYRTPVDGLSVGAVLANLGSMSELRAERSTLPSLMRLGAAYRGPLESISSEFTVASDYQLVFPASASLLSVGGELLFEKTLAARAGYLFGSEGRKFSAGIGVIYGIVGFDYAYAPLVEGLGTAHTFSLFVNL